MSLFKEKDDFLVKTFSEQFNRDSDNESDCNESQTCDRKRPKLEETTEETVEELEESLIECETIDDSPDVIEIYSDSDDLVVEEEKNACSITEETDISTKKLNVSQSSLDNDDRDFNLKLIIVGQCRRFPTTYATTLQESLKSLLEDLTKINKSLVVTVNGDPVPLSESPRSLGLTTASILHAVEVSETFNQPNQMANPNEIILKLQDGNRKHTKEFKIMKNEPILELKKLYAAEFGIKDTGTIKLSFDGDIVSNETTPADLEMESGETFDVILG